VRGARFLVVSFMACAGASGVDAGPPQPCLALLQCASTCGSGDTACVQACGTHGSAESSAAFTTFEACETTYGCVDFTCAAQHCQREAAGCGLILSTADGGGRIVDEDDGG
jgi:hypothetical protein